jgi:hypothetical protein
VNIPKLSQGALAAISEIKPQARTPDLELENRIEWVLAHARSMSAGVRLVLAEIDEIGLSLKRGWITPEQAVGDLTMLEELPVRIAAVFYRGGSGNDAI